MPTARSRRRDITEAALRVFARKGYRRAVVADVAAEAGVSKGTIYTYFARKELLLGAVFDRIADDAARRRRRIANSRRPPLEKIRALLGVVPDVFASDATLAAAMLDVWMAGLRDPDRFEIDVTAVHRETRSLLQDLLVEAAEQGDMDCDLPASTPTVLLGAADGVFLQWLLDPEQVDVSDCLHDVIDLLGCRRLPTAEPSSTP